MWTCTAFLISYFRTNGSNTEIEMIWNLCLNFVVKIDLSGFEYVPRYNLEITKNLQICISKIHKIVDVFFNQ